MKKRVILLLIGILLLTPKVAFAEGETCEYTNYYFFAEINTSTGVQQGITAANDGVWKRSHYTYFPGLPDGATIDQEKSKKVCLSKGNNVVDTSNGCEDEGLTLTAYYDKFEKLINKGRKKTSFDTPSGSTFYVEYDVSKTEKHFMHGAWTSQRGGTIDNTGDGYVNFSIGTDGSVLEPSTIAGGSFLPDTLITFSDLIGYNAFEAHIERDITQEKLEQATPYNSKWGNNTTLTPALYKIVYTMNCPAEPKYNARIDYYYKGTTDKVEFKDSSKNPYTESDLQKGYGEGSNKVTITSPEAKNESCKPLTPSVDIVISSTNPEDFHEVVEYECTSFEATINYFIVDDDGKKTVVKKFDDGSPSPYHEEGLKNGDKRSVKSPEIKGCSPDKSKVDFTIENTNFETDVTYNCSKVKSSPATGTLIYLTWLLGFASLGCSIYYFKKAKDEAKVNE